jgi:hypothetical protein
MLRLFDFLDHQPPRIVECGQPGLDVESANHLTPMVLSARG